MKKKLMALAVALSLGCIALVGVGVGAGHGVAAAEDDRFRISGTTLTAYLGEDTFVSIPDTVTVIAEGAFEGRETLVSVEIPDSVSVISYNAFKGCTGLTNITLSDSITKVGPGAFEGCTALETVEIGKNVSSWGTGVFTDCESLSKLILDENNEYLTYYNGALYNGNMTMLYQVLPGREGDNYVMPDTVETIDAYALWNMKNTKNVKVSNKVDTIPSYAFSNMGSVENVVIQSPTAAIEERAFANNEKLAQVIVPASVTDIHRKAFAYSPNMAICTEPDTEADLFGKILGVEVIYEPEYPKDFMDSNVNLDEKPNVGTAGQNPSGGNTQQNPAAGTEQAAASGNQTDATTGDNGDTGTGQKDESGFPSSSGYAHPLDVPESDEVIGKTVIVGGRAVFLMNNHDGQVYGIPKDASADVMTEEEAAAQESREEEAADSETDTPQGSDMTAASGTRDKISVTIEAETPKDNSAIPQRKYYRQKSLTSYEIEDTINTIGRLAFAESGLKAIEIPGNVTSIEYGAFMGCASLENVTIPATVSNIGTKAFEGTPWLENLMSGDEEFLIVGDGILLAYTGNDEHVAIPAGVKQIGPEAFKGHTEIVDVDIPESVTKICAEAFRNCSSLTGLTGCEGLKTVIRGAFYGTQISESDF
ncbi:MAG: leucine-rich repeat domain-containing protein [Roseburia sp.]|nr:leucine-rich repeat domain-containing protein [Roseburia sp.]